MGMMGYSAGALTGGAVAGLLIAVLILVAVVLLARALPSLYSAGDGKSARRRRATPEELLAKRYARGEIGWPEYREGLVSLLKERYVRGELEIDAYEKELARLLEAKPTPTPRSASPAASPSGS